MPREREALPTEDMRPTQLASGLCKLRARLCLFFAYSMTENANIDRAIQDKALIRLVTLIVGCVAVILLVLRLHLLLLYAGAADDVGSGDGSRIALIAAPLLLSVPGLTLAWLGRAPRTALALVLMALPLAVAAWLGV